MLWWLPNTPDKITAKKPACPLHTQLGWTVQSILTNGHPNRIQRQFFSSCQHQTTIFQPAKQGMDLLSCRVTEGKMLGRRVNNYSWRQKPCSWAENIVLNFGLCLAKKVALMLKPTCAKNSNVLGICGCQDAGLVTLYRCRCLDAGLMVF